MHEATLSFTSPEQILALFGAQDRYLRQVRDAVGVNVTLRGDELRLHGTNDQVKRGMEVFGNLRAIVELRGELGEQDVLQALGTVPKPMSSPQAGIDLFEKARKVQARTPGQVEYVQAIREHDLVFCVGPAGCGKTYLAVAMALNSLRQEQVRKIVLVRPLVEAGEKLGYLPGDLLAKVNPFLRPLLDALTDMLDFEQVKRYMERDVIEIVPLAYMRGRTLTSTFVILDEAQNATKTQMKMFLTRLGHGSKIVATGDTTQTDLPDETPSGLIDAVERLSGIEGVATVELTGRDIVRHRLVREIVRAYDEGEDEGQGRRLRRKG